MAERRLEWGSLRKSFVEYLESKQYNRAYMDDMIRYLDRYLIAIDGPGGIIQIFSKVKSGRRHLWLGLRTLFNYLEAMGFSLDYLDQLRKAMPRVQCGIDLKVPDEGSILRSLQKLSRAPEKYQNLYNLLLDSGLRLVEAVKIIDEFNAERVERINSLYRILIGQFRGSKQAYYAYFTDYTLKGLIQGPKESLNAKAATRYFRKMGFISPKYLRKFVFDKMIELKVPESVADFIEGRVATRIGARHYMMLSRQADRFYGKYAEYLEELRPRALSA